MSQASRQIVEPELNPQQEAAVSESKSTLVLSGAGTGKTRVITARIARLLAEGVAPDRILAATFTNKAATEMKERIGSPHLVRDLYIGTFHSLSARLLRQHPEETGLPSNFRIIDSGDQLAIIRRILHEDLEQSKYTDGGPDPREMRAAINKLKESGLRSDSVTRIMAGDLVRKAYAIYEENLAAEKKADFIELILRCNELLRDNPAVRKKWSDHFQHVLIDELQDISDMQMTWISLLRGRHTIYFGVGDDDQSIYAFRGANPSLMVDFKSKFAKNNIHRLEHNYRSSNRILELANTVITSNRDRIGKNLIGTGESGELPRYSCFPTDEEEAQAITLEISRLVATGVGVGSIAIFYRNHALSQIIEQQLRSHNIPFRVRGSQRFYERPEVKAVIAYLSAASNPEDDESVLETINNPRRGVGEAMIRKLREAAGSRPLWHVLGDVKPEKIKDYVKCIEKIAATAKKSLPKAVEVAINDSGLRAHYESKGARERERIEHMSEVVSEAARFVESGSRELSEFLAHVSLEGDASDGPGDQISLMTIHAAKGLEFDHVFVAGVEDGVLPPIAAFGQLTFRGNSF
ncbi:MAG: UvrD-helicase domain-containing protein, partial [Betaproteobacteria bacterium]|nr:UvrD-helicase domain-containing protein [Betaproteobacteria bacterium]